MCGLFVSGIPNCRHTYLSWGKAYRRDSKHKPYSIATHRVNLFVTGTLCLCIFDHIADLAQLHIVFTKKAEEEKFINIWWKPWSRSSFPVTNQICFFKYKQTILIVPDMEHSSLNVGADDVLYWFVIPWVWGRGAGILRVIALWNFRLLGSTVTTGDTATPRPSSLAVSSESIICACKDFYLHF